MYNCFRNATTVNKRQSQAQNSIPVVIWLWSCIVSLLAIAKKSKSRFYPPHSRCVLSFLSLSLSLFRSLFLSLSLSLSLSFALCFSLSLCISLYQSISVCLSVCLYLALFSYSIASSLCVFPFLSLPSRSLLLPLSACFPCSFFLFPSFSFLRSHSMCPFVFCFFSSSPSLTLTLSLYPNEQVYGLQVHVQ